MLDGSVVSLGAGATVIDGRFSIGFDGEPPFGEGKMDVSCTGGGNDVRNDGWEKALIALDELAAPRSFPAPRARLPRQWQSNKTKVQLRDGISFDYCPVFSRSLSCDRWFHQRMLSRGAEILVQLRNSCFLRFLF
jgi:hypothetical protein